MVLLPAANLDKIVTAHGLNRGAGVAVLVLGGYLQIIEWVDLFPWNNIRGGNGQEMLDLGLGAATLVLAVMLWRGYRVAAPVAVAALAAWAWLQVTTWWIPYFNGASPQWARIYRRWFDGTISWLPRSDSHLPPDASHFVLHVLIAVALAACVMASVSQFRTNQASATGQ